MTWDQIREFQRSGKKCRCGIKATTDGRLITDTNILFAKIRGEHACPPRSLFLPALLWLVALTAVFTALFDLTK